jgi:hypothetical protein
MAYNVGNPGPCMEQAHKCPEVVFINRCTFVKSISETVKDSENLSTLK